MPKGLVTRTAGKHFDAMLQHNVDRRRSNEDVFVENSTYARHRLKDRIIKEEMIPYVCDDCGLTDEWNDKKITLQLDHINGVNDDNRIENLRFLCPNCHSQTHSYAAKNRNNPLRKPKRNYKPNISVV
jgi:5-methylcytosine-specific restriction endonuclease McrA